MIYKLLSWPTIRLNPQIITPMKGVIITIPLFYLHFKDVQAGWGLENKLFSDSKLLGDAPHKVFANVREEYPEASWVDSLLHSARLFHSAEWLPWPTVSSHTVLAWHRGASRSGPCISPSPSPKPFLSPSSWSVPKGDTRPVLMLVTMLGMNFLFLKPTLLYSLPKSSLFFRIALTGQNKSGTQSQKA